MEGENSNELNEECIVVYHPVFLSIFSDLEKMLEARAVILSSKYRIYTFKWMI